MKIFVKSRDDMRSLYPEPGKKTVVVSINDPSLGPPNLQKFGPENVVYLFFYDTTDPMSSIQPADANTLLDFLEKNRDADVMYVHCFAGISRSSGTAIAIAEILGDKEQADHWRVLKPWYNRYVLNLIQNMYTLRKTREAQDLAA